MTFIQLFSDTGLPHGLCYLWDSGLITLHLLSDVLIGLSYLGIGATLGYMVHRLRRDIPFHWMFLCFGTFIAACGLTHWMEVWTLWHPTYWLAGDVKALTAVASIGTALALPPVLPRVVTMVQAAKLSEERKQKLEAAHAELVGLYARVKELDELKTQFFANVSHELRTPLMLVLGPVTRLLGSQGLPGEAQRDLAVVARNAQILLKHINDLLDLSKVDASQLQLRPESLDLVHLVRCIASNFEVLAEERQMEFQLETPASFPITADEDKLQRVVLNLLSNAFKFTPNGGRIRVTVERRDTHAVISVHDSGPGIPAADRDMIFERFRQLKGGLDRRVGGTGLGLAIAKEFIELHGGAVRVTDAPEGGAGFEVELPCGVGQPAAAVNAAGGKTAAVQATLAELHQPSSCALQLVDAPDVRSEPVILVVEDNADMAQFIAGVLAERGQIQVAHDAPTALDWLPRLQPDLLITDIMMPGMTGQTLIEHIRRDGTWENLPIIVITAKADDELRARLLRDGVQDYLIKPFHQDELRARVENWLTIKRVRDVLQRAVASQGRNLEELAVALAEKRRELQTVNRSIERKVEERTQALAAANEKLRELDQLKSSFVSTVSHELRTPLTAIRGYADNLLIGIGGPLSEKTTAAIRRIKENADRLTRLLNDLLDLSRIEAGQFRLQARPLELMGVLRDVLDSLQGLAAQKEIGIVTAQDALPLVMGDRDKLFQILSNLVHNAIKFTPPGGHIRVEAHAHPEVVQVTVTDTGCGIAPEDLPKVFDKFFRSSSTEPHTRGAGLGLAIVKRLVELQGGQIWADSELQAGSRFSFTIPRAAGSADVREGRQQTVTLDSF